MGKVTLQGYIVVPEDELLAVRAALPEHIRLTRQEPGCLEFNVEEVSGKPGRFDVFEIFLTMMDFESHQARVKSSDWGVVTKNVQRHYTIDEA